MFSSALGRFGGRLHTSGVDAMGEMASRVGVGHGWTGLRNGDSEV